ncbi:MAG: UDP-N-acetylmuramoyl-tripeptide--D-alanyl-D-alanine ligase [Eubacteriales bacterium]|nr:UDP-N-acetylmuramoyl-tripeptide--D-alanyl-D-alanine ligase [Eubacteriales bacterium]MDD3881804.1 UDP-N-acetylmuramoyl-tripeptide--D-alanyl-D-alanine ligase [Eubacteriales bacterium]MDD4513573.1 UDP-N-acetylmuramoyl-tripeptide--D-alanyl-D-alanine ligase [Eubacteriales bacterium]
MTAASIILALSPAAACVLASRGHIHYFQLESYQFPGYFKTLKRNRLKAYLPGALIAIWLLCLMMLENTAARAMSQTVDVIASIVVFILSALGGLVLPKWFRKSNKKPLRYTARVKRLYAVYSVMMTAICLALSALLPVAPLLAALPLFIPWLTALAGLIAWPIEKLISEMYFRDARRKLLSMPGLIRIGITGSYGKTSVKFILGTLLSEKYNTLVTPSSYNTPMGVTRVIRTQLDPSFQVFVAEMGARHVGDIKEMCRLVRPQYGILTSVGPQHLDTFKTIERIRDTKYELINALPQDTLAVFPDDNGICSELYGKTGKGKALAGLNTADDVYADELFVSAEGSEFTLHTPAGSIRCKTKLLGEHNIMNIALACAMCDKLGLSLAQMQRGIGKLTPVEHRLQMLSSGGLFTVIDDAFNSNPHGAHMALKTLRQFTGGRKIIITPGMVELGDREAEFNRAFGVEMADSADIAILVGKRHSEPIRDGLLSAGFPKENLHIVQSLEESTLLLQSLIQKGDVVLYENDLPDNYSEA